MPTSPDTERSPAIAATKVPATACVAVRCEGVVGEVVGVEADADIASLRRTALARLIELGALVGVTEIIGVPKSAGSITGSLFCPRFWWAVLWTALMVSTNSRTTAKRFCSEQSRLTANVQ